MGIRGEEIRAQFFEGSVVFGSTKEITSRIVSVVPTRSVMVFSSASSALIRCATVCVGSNSWAMRRFWSEAHAR